MPKKIDERDLHWIERTVEYAHYGEDFEQCQQIERLKALVDEQRLIIKEQYERAEKAESRSFWWRMWAWFALAVVVVLLAALNVVRH